VSAVSPYRVVRSRSTAGDFHARTVPVPASREIWRHDLTRPALVLGSTQDRSDVDLDACRRAGVEVVRRRSGGGAVLLVPGQVTWLDVIVPAAMPGWSADVHGPMVWLGNGLAGAIARATGIDDLVVHDAAMRTTAWSRLVCFDGLGAGEVLLGDRKLVGISQRRTRDAARLQCCWYSEYDPQRLLALLDPAAGRPAAEDLAQVATLPAGSADAIVRELVATLA
jgi:lipoate-protein ligase A